MAAGRLVLAARVALLLAVTLGGCVQDDGSTFDPIKQWTEVTVDEEREAGMEFDREIRKVAVVIDDPLVVGFVNDLGQDIVRTIEPQPFIYHFRVILDPRLNAFAVPGGYVYIHSGTILAASSVEELAGVMAHEIGHVKGRHIARLQEKLAIPSLLASLAGMAAAVAAKQGGALVTAQAINVAMQLQFTRELEAEADDLGLTFMSRSGYDPRGMAHFFERIAAEERPGAIEIPPYLYSHPALPERIRAVEAALPSLHVQGKPPPEMQPNFDEAQLRLLQLVESQRTSFAQGKATADRAAGDAALLQAEKRVAEGDVSGAIAFLGRAETTQADDPRLPFRRAELLEQAGRNDEAIAAWRQTLRLEPTRAQVLYRLGLACKTRGERHRAVFYLEQAESRFGAGSELRKKASWEVEKLTFPIVDRAGLADGVDSKGADTGAGFSRESFTTADAKAVWWARLHGRYWEDKYLDKLTVRWRDPTGAVHTAGAIEEEGKPLVVASLPIAGDAALEPGTWTVEAVFEGDVVDRRTFEIRATQ